MVLGFHHADGCGEEMKRISQSDTANAQYRLRQDGIEATRSGAMRKSASLDEPEFLFNHKKSMKKAMKSNVKRRRGAGQGMRTHAMSSSWYKDGSIQQAARLLDNMLGTTGVSAQSQAAPTLPKLLLYKDIRILGGLGGAGGGVAGAILGPATSSAFGFGETKSCRGEAFSSAIRRELSISRQIDFFLKFF